MIKSISIGCIRVFCIILYNLKEEEKKTLESAAKPKTKIKKKLPWHVLTLTRISHDENADDERG